MAQLPIDAAQVVGLFMESIFYGIFLVTFFDCIRVLTMSDGQFKSFNKIHLKMMLAAIAMFILGSLDVAFHLYHNLQAFITFEGDPIEEFSKVSNWVNVMGMGCYVGQTFVGDSILLYRCWIIWSRNWFVVIVPTLLWLGGTACGALTIYKEATLHDSDGLLNVSQIIPFISSMLSLTLVTNLLTTSLIVYRIQKIRCRLQHRTAHTSMVHTPLVNVMRLLIESGLLYTISITVLFILYKLSHNAQYGVSNAVVQIIGINFNLIITRVDRGEATQPSTQRHNGTSPTTVALHSISIHTTVSRYPDHAVTPSQKNVVPDPELGLVKPKEAHYHAY